MNDSVAIANALLQIKAVTLSPKSPYTWASGIKSPIYCDNRMTISYPAVRKQITNAFVELIRQQYPEAEAIVGTATAGIPQACWVADALNLPTAYVRPKSKDHGKANQIEGHLAPFSKVVVIEDLVSTGGSSIQACTALRDSNIAILGVCAIFTYEMQQAEERFHQANIALHTLSNYSILVQEAIKQQYIQADDLHTLDLWKQDPVKYTALY